MAETVNDDSVIQSRDAVGCTWAPGPAGSTVCLTVNNPTPAGGAVLDRLQMTYTAPSTNICATTFEVRYETRTASPVHYRRGTATGCAPLTRGWVWDPNPNITLQHGSQVCGRAKNAVTGNAWTPWACVRINA